MTQGGLFGDGEVVKGASISETAPARGASFEAGRDAHGCADAPAPGRQAATPAFEGKPLRCSRGLGRGEVILYGPPGTGKTTIASLIAQTMGQNFVGLGAEPVAEVRGVDAGAAPGPRREDGAVHRRGAPVSKTHKDALRR